MYDADNLYLLARWNDSTPLNNPGVTSGDLGFRGDCLQTRVIVVVRISRTKKSTHLTCWRGHDGRDVIKVELGKRLNDGVITDLKTLGAKQAFTVADDGKHYAQEIAIPWAQLAQSGKSPGPGGALRLAVEANFTIGSRRSHDLQGLLSAGHDARSSPSPSGRSASGAPPNSSGKDTWLPAGCG